MNGRILPLLGVAAAGLAAWSTAGAGTEAETTDTEAETADTAWVTTAEAQTTSASSAPETIATRLPETDTAPTTASIPTSSIPTTSTLVVPPTAIDREFAAPDDAATDDPSFDRGPDVVLDVAAPPVAGWAAFDASIRRALIRPENTAISVSVLIGGDVVHESAFGVRVPGTNDLAEVGDRFRIASISKTITSIVALSLVEDGVVGLDDPVGQRVADHIGVPVGSSANLTLRQLLTHRSGFGDYDAAFFRGGAANCRDAAVQGLASGAAGGGYNYSNMNYCVAGLAIEALTGLSYERVAYRELLTPLGIQGMRLSPTVDPGPDEVQHWTTPGRNYMETLGAAGAWLANPTDIVTIMNSIDPETPGFAPIGSDMIATMVTPPLGQYGQRGYAYGIQSFGGEVFGHTGTIESTHAMVLDRGDGVTWAIMVAGQVPDRSLSLENVVNDAFAAGGFVAG